MKEPNWDEIPQTELLRIVAMNSREAARAIRHIKMLLLCVAGFAFVYFTVKGDPF